MLFSSMVFLWIFLPVVIIGNGLLTQLPFSDEKRYGRIGTAGSGLRCFRAASRVRAVRRGL